MAVRGSATASRYGFTIEYPMTGGMVLAGSDAAGYYVRRLFMGYTVAEACRMMRRELRGGAS